MALCQEGCPAAHISPTHCAPHSSSEEAIYRLQIATLREDAALFQAFSACQNIRGRRWNLPSCTCTGWRWVRRSGSFFCPFIIVTPCRPLEPLGTFRGLEGKAWLPQSREEAAGVSLSATFLQTLAQMKILHRFLSKSLPSSEGSRMRQGHLRWSADKQQQEHVPNLCSKLCTNDFTPP